MAVGTDKRLSQRDVNAFIAHFLHFLGKVKPNIGRVRIFFIPAGSSFEKSGLQFRQGGMTES